MKFESNYFALSMLNGYCNSWSPLPPKFIQDAQIVTFQETNIFSYTQLTRFIAKMDVQGQTILHLTRDMDHVVGEYLPQNL